MSPEKCIRMANQIATFFASQDKDEAVSGIADHITSFWEPRMRQQLFDLVSAGEGAFDPLVIAALPQIRKPAPQDA
jgi:formate dehydrogenase subunit delta